MWLVTGGAGFIGAHLVTQLVRHGMPVRVLDNFSTGRREKLDPVLDQIELIDGDIRDMATVREAVRNVEVIFHLAAKASVPESIIDPVTTSDVNILGTLQVLLAARDAGCRRVVFSSSCAIYGDLPATPKSEHMAPAPRSPYAVSKIAGEYLCAVFTRVYGLETVALRYFNVFGPGQDPDSPYAAVVPRFLHALQHGIAPIIYGDGEQARDFVYIDDVVAANLAAAVAPSAPGQVFNIASGRTVTVNEVLAMTACRLKKPATPRRVAARPGDLRHSAADVTAARQILGFAAQVPFEQGLACMVLASHDVPVGAR